MDNKKKFYKLKYHFKYNSHAMDFEGNIDEELKDKLIKQWNDGKYSDKSCFANMISQNKLASIDLKEVYLITAEEVDQ